MTNTDSNMKILLDNYFIQEDIPLANSIRSTLLQIQSTKNLVHYNALMSKILQSPDEVNKETNLFTLLLSVTLLMRKATSFIELMIKLKNNQMIKELFTKIQIANEDTLNEEYEDALFLVKDYLLDNADLLFQFIDYAVKSNAYQLYPVFSLLIQHFTRNSTLTEVSTLLPLMIVNEIELSTCAINSSIDFYCRMNLLEEAQAFFNKLCQYKPSRLFSQYTNGLNMKKYQSGTGVNIVTYGTFIKWLCKKSHMDLAMYYYQSLKEQDLLKDEVIYNLLIDGCAKCGDIQSLKDLYFDMLNNSIKPTIITFNTIIDAYIRTKDLQSAWRIYEDLIKNDIQPDNFTLSNLFKGIRLPCHKEHFDRALGILKSLSSSSKSKGDDHEQKGADIILINVLLDSCIAMRESKLLIELFNDVINEKMPNIIPDIITYNTFIKGCAQMGLSDQALLAYDSLCSNSLKFNVYPNDVTFNTLIDVYVRSGNMNQVWSMIAKMKSLNIKPDNFTYSTIIKSLNKNTNLSLKEDSDSNQNESELDLAFKLFENVKKTAKPDEILYNCIMDACLRFNQIDKMLELYDSMQLEGVMPSSITCGIVIKAYGMKGNLNKALEIYEQMKEEKIEISSVTYGGLINACIQNNNLLKAFDLYEELQKTGYEMNTILYTTLIKAYAKTKDLPKVLEIFSKMKESPSNSPNNVTYNSVIDCCIKANDFTKANEIFEELYNKDSGDGTVHADIITFSTLIKGVLKNGDFDAAIKYYDMMKHKNVKPDEVLLNSLLDGCDKCNRYSQAIELFESVKGYGIEPTMMSYSIMMKLLGRLNDYQYSKNLFDEIIKKNKNVSLIIFTCFIRTCLFNNDATTAIDTFNSFGKYHLCPDAIAFSTMINGITALSYDKGLCADLLKMVHQSVELDLMLHRRCYIAVLKYLKGCGQFNKAKELGQYLESHNRLEPRKISNDSSNKHPSYTTVTPISNSIINSNAISRAINQIQQQQKNDDKQRKPLAQLKDYTKNYNAETGNNYEQSKKHDENGFLYSFNNTPSDKSLNQHQEDYSLELKKKTYQNTYYAYNCFDNNQNQFPNSSTIKLQQQEKPKKKFNRF